MNIQETFEICDEYKNIIDAITDIVFDAKELPQGEGWEHTLIKRVGTLVEENVRMRRCLEQFDIAAEFNVDDAELSNDDAVCRCLDFAFKDYESWGQDEEGVSIRNIHVVCKQCGESYSYEIVRTIVEYEKLKDDYVILQDAHAHLRKEKDNLAKEVANLAIESTNREVALAKLQAEVKALCSSAQNPQIKKVREEHMQTVKESMGARNAYMDVIRELATMVGVKQ